MRRLGYILSIFAVAALAACTEDPVWIPENRPNPARREAAIDNGFDNVLVMYCAAYNNLQSDIEANLQQMTKGYVPALHDKNAIVVFSHMSDSDFDHSTPKNPVIFRMYRDGGNIVNDTLKVYDTDVCSASPSTVKDYLLFIRDKFPSSHYGFLITSHGTGWVPPEYEMDSEENHGLIWSAAPSSVGVQQGEMENIWMDVCEMGKAIPFHLDYIIFDACLMSCVEIAYMFRNICDYIIASPTEILTQGFEYRTMASRLFADGGPDLEAVCKDYMSARSSATVALIDCSRIEEVAAACRTIYDNHAESVMDIESSTIQSYNVTYSCFYDLRDMCKVLGASPGELSNLDAALSRCIIYKGTTAYFLSKKIDPTRFSGFSTFLPRRHTPILNSLYKETEWNKTTGLLK